MKLPKQRKWIRTCQECGHQQVDTTPPCEKGYVTWAQHKCKKCKSQALDFGSWEPDPTEIDMPDE